MKKYLLFFVTLCMSLVSVAQKPSKKAFPASCPSIIGEWTVGEQINMSDATNPEGVVYTSDREGAQTFFMGKGALTSDDGQWWAVYPAAALRMWSPQYLHFMIPNEQIANPGGIPQGSVIMASCTDGYDLDFKPLVGYVKFGLGPDLPPVKEVRIHAGKNISGQFKVKMGEKPLKVVNGSGTRYQNIVVKAEEGKTLSVGEYRAALYARIFPDGLTVEVVAADGKVAIVRIEEKVTVTLGTALNIGVFDNLEFIDKQAMYGSNYNNEGVVFWIDPADPYKGKIVSASGSKQPWNPAVCEQMSRQTGQSWRLPDMKEANAIFNTYYGQPQDDPRTLGDDFSTTVKGMAARAKFDASMAAIPGSTPLESKGLNGDSIWTDKETKNDNRRIHYVRLIVYSNGSALKDNTDRYLRCVRDVQLNYGE